MFGALQTALQFFLNGGNVIRVHQGGKRLNRAAELAGFHSVQFIHPVGPLDPVVLDVPIPDAQLPGLGGEAQTFLASAQRLRGAPLLLRQIGRVVQLRSALTGRPG